MHRLLELVMDQGSIFEIQPTFGRALITCLARLNGHPVGIVANNPMVSGGAMGAKRSAQTDPFHRTVRLLPHPADLFRGHPGIHDRHRSRAGSHPARRDENGLRDSSGQGAHYHAGHSEMLRHGRHGHLRQRRPGLQDCLALRRVGLPAHRGRGAAAYRRDIANAENPAAREKELEEELRQYTSPFRSAEAFAVEEIIDPRETRPFLCNFIALTRNRLRNLLGPTDKRGVSP